MQPFHRRLARVLPALLLGLLPAGITWAQDGPRALTATRQTLVHGGTERHYELRVPASPPPAAGWPVVLVLHGGGGNAANAEAMTGFSALAAREGFMVAYPEGTGRLGGRLQTWNAGHCCGQAMNRRVDDVGFIDAVVAELIARHMADPRRVYLTGLSNGGMMTHRAALEKPRRFAAIAPVIASVFGDEPLAASPVSALIINGAQDTAVPPQGGAPGGRFPDAWDGTPVRPARDQASLWAASSGCDREPRHEVRPGYQRWTHTCPAGWAVEQVLVDDNGHAWPGGKKGSLRGDTPSARFDATATIWAFFRDRSR